MKLRLKTDTVIKEEKLTEGIMINWLAKFFNVLLFGKTQSVLKKIQQDPELAEKARKVVETSKDLEDYLEKNKDKMSPEVVAFINKFKN